MCPALLRRLFKVRLLPLAAFGGLALTLGGCTPLDQYVRNGFKVGPNYGRPPAPVEGEWIDAADRRVRKESDDLSRWWTVFNDPVLNALICDAYRQNLTLREAGFRVLQARAELGFAIGGFFPQQQVAQGGFIQRGVSLKVANRVATPQRWFGTWNYGFSLAWEVDFWGRLRRTIEAARDHLDASVEDFDDVLVTLLGDVASNYVTLRTLEQQLEYLRTNVALQRTSLDIARAKFKGGQASELDVDQAQTILSQTESQVPQQLVQIRQTTNRLCILMGIPPEELRARLGPAPIPTAPPEVAAGMPADLLRRRPDVRREERRAAEECARIGIADADFYPAITVLGTVGYAASEFSRMFNSKAFYGSVGPTFQWNVLNYGRVLMNVRRQEAKFQEQIAHYQQTVLRASEEAENGLVTFLQAHERTRFAAESVAAAVKAVQVAQSQYKNGLINFNRVALLQQNLVTQQNLLATARGEIAQGLIQVYRALGGGWQIRYTGCPESLHEPGEPVKIPLKVQVLPPPQQVMPAPGGRS